MDILVSNNRIPQTPMHVYKGTSDFASILKDMEKGEFPVGTGVPFPVNFEEEENPTNPMSPWTQNQSTQFYEPPRSEIIGPKVFGL